VKFPAVIPLVLVSLAPVIAHGLDQTDVGVYGLIHRDGHLTEDRYRLLKGEGRWEIEAITPGGEWENITCEVDCQLSASSDADVEFFMGAKPPPGMSATCVHNKAFAFCRVEETVSGRRHYRLIALITGDPIHMKLQRMEDPSSGAAP
jgi:hypothetical protein